MSLLAEGSLLLVILRWLCREFSEPGAEEALIPDFITVLTFISVGTGTVAKDTNTAVAADGVYTMVRYAGR